MYLVVPPGGEVAVTQYLVAFLQYPLSVETTGPYALQEDPEVWDEYRAALRDSGLSLTLEPIEKWSFYEAVAKPDHILTIQTADQQRFGNILLTIGVRMEAGR